MFVNKANLKNKSEKDILQKELEFYTHLLTQHEKNKEKKIFAFPGTSSSNSIKRPYSIYINHSSNLNEMIPSNESSRMDKRIFQKKHSSNNNNVFSYSKRKNTSSIQFDGTPQIPNALSSLKHMSIKQNLKAPVAICSDLNQSSRFCKRNSAMNQSKKLPIYETNISNTLPMINGRTSTVSESEFSASRNDSSKSGSKVWISEKTSEKSASKMLVVNETHALSETLMNKEASVKSAPRVRMNVKTTSESDSNAVKKTSLIRDSKVSRNRQVFAKSDSRALMSEIASVTKQLKMKSENRYSSAKLLQSPSRFKRTNSSGKSKDKVYLFSKPKSLQNVQQSAIINNKFCKPLTEMTSNISVGSKNQLMLFNKTEIGMQNASNLQFIDNQEHFQKDDAKKHLLEELNAVEKLLNATTKKSVKTSNNSEVPMGKVLLNNKFDPRIYNFKSHKIILSSNKKLTTSADLGHNSLVEKNKFVQKQRLKFDKNSPLIGSFVQISPRHVKLNQTSKLKLLPRSKETKHLSKSVNRIKTQYKVINKAHIKKLSANNKSDLSLKSMKRHSNINIQKNFYKLVNNDNLKLNKIPISSSERLFANRNHPSSFSLSRNIFSPSKKMSHKVYKMYNSSPLRRSTIKYKQSLSLINDSKLSKSLLNNEFKPSAETSGVDVDLLLELAAENKDRLSKSFSRRRLYKSRNRLVNSYSAQARTAKMIKTKYLNPYKKAVDYRSLPFINKSLKGFKNSHVATLSKKCRNFPLELGSRKDHLKKIVNLGGENFIIGSSGRTLKKLHNQNSKTRRTSYKKTYERKSVIKIPNSVSKMIASRALNRSISQALSASMKKKMQKINTYCMFYNRFGRCNKGIECPFVHDPSKIAVCTRYLRGTCKIKGCLFSHEINPGKMAICSFFLQDACAKEDCPYLHEKLSPDAELCKAFVQGYCPHGKDCKKAHILICSKFLRGLCDKGKDCSFPHPMKKEKVAISKSSDDNAGKDESQLETVLRYFESNPQEHVTSGLVVPRIKSLPEQPSFISLTMDKTD